MLPRVPSTLRKEADVIVFPLSGPPYIRTLSFLANAKGDAEPDIRECPYCTGPCTGTQSINELWFPRFSHETNCRARQLTQPFASLLDPHPDRPIHEEGYIWKKKSVLQTEDQLNFTIYHTLPLDVSVDEFKLITKKWYQHLQRHKQAIDTFEFLPDKQPLTPTQSSARCIIC